jgi:hypothetical protein
MSAPPTHLADVAVGEWIEERLGTFGTVSGLVPRAFDSYVRVTHRDELDDQFEGLSRQTLTVLCEVVTGHSAVDDCVFAIWDGYGWLHGGRSSFLAVATYPGAPDPELVAAMQAANAAPAFPDVVLSGPKLTLPHRSYYLFEGALSSALDFGKRSQILEREEFEPHTPDLIWPQDHSWFIAPDTDLRFTYVAAGASLARRISADKRLASNEVPADGRFMDIEPH